MFIDTHAHILNKYYDNIDEILNKIKSSGVNKVINAGCSLEESQEVLKLTRESDMLYCAVGIHPENVGTYKNTDLGVLEKMLKEDKVLAIGEIGLDYHYTKDNKEKQIELFEAQLKMAEKYNMPVVVHSRDATLDTINCLKKYKVRGIIHSFSGSLEIARIYEKMGFLFGVNGVITFKNCNLKEVYKQIDINKIVLETDSPYLTPVPYRGQKNDSSHIIDIAGFVSNLYGISKEQLAKITNANVSKVFDKLK